MSKSDEITLGNDNVVFFKKSTRYVFRYISEETKLQFDQKILRKFIDTILMVIKDFFDTNPEYCEKFFKVYKYYLEKEIHDEEFQKIIVAVLLEGFTKIVGYLETHNDIVNLKDSKKKSDKLLSLDTIKNFVYYSWCLKLYSFYKFLANVKVPDKVDKYIMNYLIDKYLIKSDLSNILLNIVKGKVISTIKSRGEMWRYLSLSIRKSPDLYISQLYNYTVIYILLFMKNAYNPIGYISNFIDRQIIYVFSDVYVNEVVYHDIDDYHVVHKDLKTYVIVNKISSVLLDSLYLNYHKDQVNEYLKKYSTNTNILNLLVYPLIKKLLLNNNPQATIYLNHSNKIFSLYAALFYRKFLNFKYIPKLLEANSIKSKRIIQKRQVRETITINTLYSTNEKLRNFDVFKENQVFNSIINNLNTQIYYNIISKKIIEFNLYDFIQEFSQILDLLHNETRLKEIYDELENDRFIINLKEINELVVSEKVENDAK